MEHNYDDIILLERYLEQSLSQEEIRTVEQRLSQEPEFKELYQNEKLLVDGIRYGHLQSQRRHLKDIEAGLPPVTAGKTIPFKKYWKTLAAAATIILLVASFLLWNRPVEPDALYAQYFKPYPNVFEPAVRGTVEQNERSATFAAYERGDYALAAQGFEKIITTKEEPGALLLLGNSYLMLGDPAKAKKIFITLSKDFDELDVQAKWYLSLCYLRLGETNSAKVLLEEIAGSEGSYKEKARTLLRKVD